MDTWLDYSLREDEEDRRRSVKKPTVLWSNLKNRWERFCRWERANREASGDRERRRDARRDVEFEGRAWRMPGEQIMARSARSSKRGFREESSIHDGRARRGKEIVDRLWATSEDSASSTSPRLRFFRVLFSFAETNRIDPVPVLWFMIQKFLNKLELSVY